eukprot:TRINITY_DN7299_c0_g1_i3.p2 TRINITY_DN7299_c0_g1~~TRINITY_DN7299_c0_g1_i3.p2  ORF type:complete len:125 (+),score=30.76 TRINITY_DN7299_c0_g1_i3:155-529(+)
MCIRDRRRVHGITGMLRRSLAEKVKLNFQVQGGKLFSNIQAEVGENLFQVSERCKLPLVGACEGNCACGTCHVILSKDTYKKLPAPSEDEEDLLQVAFGHTSTCLLYTSPSPRDLSTSRMPSSA